MTGPNNFGFLIALNNVLGDSMYSGYPDPVTVAKRRAANKRARRQRKVNRLKDKS